MYGLRGLVSISPSFENPLSNGVMVPGSLSNPNASDPLTTLNQMSTNNRFGESTCSIAPLITSKISGNMLVDQSSSAGNRDELSDPTLRPRQNFFYRNIRSNSPHSLAMVLANSDACPVGPWKLDA